MKESRKSLGLILRILSCFSIILLITSYAYAETPLNIAQEIYAEVLSPFCPGRALKDCPSEAASDLKKDIIESLEQGENKQEVLDALYKEYGSQISANPRFSGVGLLAWLIPGGFLGLGLLVVTFWVLRNKKEVRE